MIAVAPHHLIYTYLISIRLLDIVKIGVGCYCFIHAKAMREAREKDKADIVPTPYFLSASSGNWKCNIINMTDDNILTCYSCFLVSILSKCPNQSLSATKVNIKNAFITYMEMGKSCAIDRNFQYENFINEARNIISEVGGIEQIIQAFKSLATNEDITECKTYLMNFGHQCRRISNSEAPMQETIYISKQF